MRADSVYSYYCSLSNKVHFLCNSLTQKGYAKALAFQAGTAENEMCHSPKVEDQVKNIFFFSGTNIFE